MNSLARLRTALRNFCLKKSFWGFCGIFSGKLDFRHEGVPGSFWNDHHSKAMIFLHRNYIPFFFQLRQQKKSMSKKKFDQNFKILVDFFLTSIFFRDFFFEKNLRYYMNVKIRARSNGAIFRAIAALLPTKRRLWKNMTLIFGKSRFWSGLAACRLVWAEFCPDRIFSNSDSQNFKTGEENRKSSSNISQTIP